MSVKHGRLSEIAERCKELSDKMTEDMKKISGNMTVIRKANDDTNDRADKVHSLLENVVLYCKSNTTMSEDDTAQLVQILQTTLSAFDNLYDSVKKSTGSTLSVDSYMLSIDSLVADINKELSETSEAEA